MGITIEHSGCIVMVDLLVPMEFTFFIYIFYMSFYLYYVWQFEGSGIQIPDRCQLYEDSYIVVTTWQLCFVNTEVWDLEFGLDNLVKSELFVGLLSSFN